MRGVFRPVMQSPPRIAALAAASVAAALLAGCTTAPTAPLGTDGSTGGERDPDRLAEAFLTEWVDDGRVVRRDQGGDTVSEGQAYGLLLAAAVGDEERFDEIWTWTDENLVRSDGLLSWQWADGAVVDSEPASDADLDAARALVVAGERFDRPDLTDQGVELGEAVLDRLTLESASGRLLLPGLWAAESEPYAYNPSYASPAAFELLGASSGDPRWGELAAGSRVVTAALLEKSPLPSNWTQVHADGSVDAMAGPSAAATAVGTDGVEYGYDAARLPIRYAESCDPTDRALAARLAPALTVESTVAARLDLGGAAVTTDEHPLGYAARAAATAAAGNRDEATADLVVAATLDVETSTYYGAAWTALAGQLLRTDHLGGCPPLDGEETEAAATAVGAAGRVQDPELGSGTSGENAQSQPVRVRIPAIGVDSGLETLGRDASGWIEPPIDFDSAGWYGDGVVPGRLGPAVIAGHIDSAVGPAVFVDLPALADGAEVLVDLSDGTTVSFTIDGRIQVPKNDFPTEEVYGPTPEAELRLVTCGGVFDDSTGHYVDNVVLFASRSN